MADTVSRLAIQVGMETRALESGSARVSSIMGELASRFRLSVDPIDLAANAISTVGSAAKEAARYVYNLAASTQEIESRLRGVADTSKEFLALRDFTFEFAGGQFDDADVSETIRKLKIEGFEIAAITDSLQIFGDIAKGSGNDLKFVADAILKMRNDGEITFKDLRLLQQSNIPIIQQLQKEYGLTQAQIKQMADSGELDFDKIAHALQRMTEEGGRFAGAIDASAQTVSGRMKTILDPIEDATRAFALLSAEGAIDIMDNLTESFGGAGASAEGYMRTLQVMADFMSAQRAATVEAAQSTGKFAEEMAKAAGEAKKLERDESFRKAGERLKESLLTPQEQYNKKLTEYNELLINGAINEETYARAVDAARQALDKQAEAASKVKKEIDAINQAQAAQGLVRGTAAAQTAIANNAARANMRGVENRLDRIAELLRNAPVIKGAKL